MKKSILLLSLFSITSLFSQIQVKWVEDEMHPETVKITVPVSFKFETGKVDMSMVLMDPIYLIMCEFKNSDSAKTFKKYVGSMQIRLTNGKVYSFMQMSDTTFGKEVSVNYIPVSKELFVGPDFLPDYYKNIEDLKKYDVEVIRFHTSRSRGYIQVNPSPNSEKQKLESFFSESITALNNFKK